MTGVAHYYSRGKSQNTLYDRTASALLIFQKDVFWYLCEAVKLWKEEIFCGCISVMIQTQVPSILTQHEPHQSSGHIIPESHRGFQHRCEFRTVRLGQKAFSFPSLRQLASRRVCQSNSEKRNWYYTFTQTKWKPSKEKSKWLIQQ